MAQKTQLLSKPLSGNGHIIKNTLSITDGGEISLYSEDDKIYINPTTFQVTSTGEIIPNTFVQGLSNKPSQTYSNQDTISNGAGEGLKITYSALGFDNFSVGSTNLTNGEYTNISTQNSNGSDLGLKVSYTVRGLDNFLAGTSSKADGTAIVSETITTGKGVGLKVKYNVINGAYNFGDIIY